jgi:hypothetical protein
MVLINVLIIIVVGAICFYLIDRFGLRQKRMGRRYDARNAGAQ